MARSGGDFDSRYNNEGRAMGGALIINLLE
jgi:hypothetical protein